MMDPEALKEANRMMIELLRTAADLIEDGTIDRWSVEQEWGHDVRLDPLGYSMRHVPNGRQKVTITLEAGHLSRARLQAWLKGAPEALPDSAGDRGSGEDTPT